MFGGYGKTILFGEHFVVHGLPGVVAALNVQTSARVLSYPAPDYKLIDSRPRFVLPVAAKAVGYQLLFENIARELGVIKPIHMELFGTLPVCSGGIGSSAAAAVALVHALNKYFALSLTHEQIAHAALAGERAVHGNPSGIDSTAALNGGVIIFQRGSAGNVITPLQLKKNLPFVLIDTGFSSDTKRVVEQVARVRAEQPALFNKLCADYQQLFKRACNALREADYATLGICMNANHLLLQELGVSSPELEQLTELARCMGALGAKLTGTGRGGLVLVLAVDVAMQQLLVKSYTQVGYKAFGVELTGL